MSRKKDNLVLFEVLSKGHSSMRVPDYVYKARQQELDKQKAAANQGLPEETQVDEPATEPEAEAPDEAVVETDAPTPVMDDTPLLTEALSVDPAPADKADADADMPEAKESSDAGEPPMAPAVIPPALPKEPISSGHGQVRSTLPSWARPRDEAQQKTGDYITPTVRRRFVEVHGDRLNLSINVVVAMLVLGAILVLWVGAFVVGRMTAPGPASANGDASPTGDVNPSPAPSIALGILDVPVEVTAGRYSPDRSYLLIQSLDSKTEDDRKAADKIVAHCVGLSMPAEVFKTSTRFLVVSRMGFRSPTSKEARSYASKVHDAGKIYQQRTRGSYAFSQVNEGRPSPKYISGKKIRRPK